MVDDIIDNIPPSRRYIIYDDMVSLADNCWSTRAHFGEEWGGGGGASYVAKPKWKKNPNSASS